MRLVNALNAINSQVWAFLILLVGCGSVITFHKSGIDIGIAAGIIGVGANMFTAATKPTASSPPTQPAQGAPES